MTKKNLTFLLVDDEEKFLKATSERIRLKGHEVLTALTGQEAVEAVKAQTVDIAVVDLRMPDMDGLVVITKLKEIQPDIKTLLLTAHGDDKMKEAVEAINSDYFEKHDMGRFWGFIKKLTRRNFVFLLVDDEETFLKSTAERIRLKGHQVLTASSGREAIMVARDNPFDIAVVDLKMPDMDGLVVITKLKEIRPGIKTVLLTAYGGEKLKEAAAALKVDYFEKQDMGRFWNFIRKLSIYLEDTMAAAGMATGGDIDEAIKIDAEKRKADTDD